MQVTKRDGRIVQFNKEKIVKALEQAFIEIDKELTDESKEKIEIIAQSIEKESKDLSVEEIQDLIEKKLMSSNRKDVAKSYILYRNNRTLERDKRSKLNKSITKRLKATNVENQNANVDERSFGGKMGAVSSDVLKEYALNNCMCRKSKENHLKNRVYIHDLDSYAIGSHNCLTIPFDDLLTKGFNTRQTDVRPANSINTASQLVAVIFQLQSLQQFGGVSASHIDWTMIPYVRKSFVKHFLNGVKYFSNNKIIYDKEELCKISINSSLYKEQPKQSRSGNQLPFTSINYGTCTLPEGRMVTKAIINGSIKGVGKFHKTSIFPCGIFVIKDGINKKPTDPNYDLFKLALKSTAQRLYPNYANGDVLMQQEWVKYDRDNKQKVIDDLSSQQYEKLIQRLEENPQLKDVLMLDIIEE